MADRGVYIRKGGIWVNANDNLDIRTRSSMMGTAPTTSNVPVVYCKVPTGWEQIYPPTIKTQDALDWKSGSGYVCWQTGPFDIAGGKSVWGWATDVYTPNLNETGGQGYFGDGVFSYERDVWREFAGWTGITRTAITNAGYAGLGKVTKVKKLTIEFNMVFGGTPSYLKKIGLVATKVGAPTYYPIGSAPASANPTLSANRSSIMFSGESKATHSGPVVFTWTDSTSMGILKDFLNGQNSWSNLCTFSGSHPNNPSSPAPVINDPNYYYTLDYCRYNRVRYKLEYEYEP